MQFIKINTALKFKILHNNIFDPWPFIFLLARNPIVWYI